MEPLVEVGHSYAIFDFLGHFRLETINMCIFAGPSDTELLQTVFSRCEPNMLYMVFAREILIMDLAVLQTIGAITLERSQAAFQCICVESSKALIFCLHRNGLISARQRVSPASTTFTLVAQSEALRFSKLTRLVSVALDPVSESTLALVTSDGRTLIQEVCFMYECPPRDRPTLLLWPLSNCCPFGLFEKFKTVGKPQFFLSACVEGHCSIGSCMAMCPTDSNEAQTLLHLAVGTTSGFVVVYDLGTGAMFRRLYIHGAGVHGVSWVGHRQVRVGRLA